MNNIIKFIIKNNYNMPYKIYHNLAYNKWYLEKALKYPEVKKSLKINEPELYKLLKDYEKTIK